MKELYIEAHEELITEYLEAHPEATDREAEDATADAAWNHMTDKLADRADFLRARAKENGTW